MSKSAKMMTSDAEIIPKFHSAIERFDLSGIGGWCVSLDSPHTPQNLELVCNGIVLFRFLTDRPRFDLTYQDAMGSLVGFSFQWGQLDDEARNIIVRQIDIDTSLDLYSYLYIRTSEKYILDCSWARAKNRLITARDLQSTLQFHYLNPINFEAEVRAGEYDKWKNEALYSDHLAFVKAFVSGDGLNDELQFRVKIRSKNTWIACELIRLRAMKLCELDSLGSEDCQFLNDEGINADSLAQLVASVVQQIKTEAVEPISNLSTLTTLQRRRAAREAHFISFQDQVVRDCKFTIKDPYGNGDVLLIDSVKIFDRQVFTFRGAKTFLLVTGGNMNAVIGFYLVDLNVFMLVDTPDLRNSQNYYTRYERMVELMAAYFQRLCASYASYREAMEVAPAIEQTSMVLIHGRAENPAHHSWNYLSGFERLLETGLLGKVDIVVRPPTEYYGSIEKLFSPSLDHVQMINYPEASAIDPFPFSPRHIVLQVGGVFISKMLKRRIYNWAVDTAEHTFLKDMLKVSATRRPLIWIGLRVGDKSWVEQIEGVASVVDTVCSRYPDVLFLLDGFSRVNEQTPIPAKWKNIFNELSEVVGSITRACKHPEAVRSLLGNTLAESIIWAASIDVYVSPLGSSQHKVGWHSQKPGIVYTSKKFADQHACNMPGGWESEGSAIPNYIRASIANDGQRRDPFDYRVNLENISLSPKTLSDQLLALIDPEFSKFRR